MKPRARGRHTAIGGALGLGDERGTVTVEYVVVLTVVSLGVAVALTAVAVPLIRTYLAQVAWIVVPIP